MSIFLRNIQLLICLVFLPLFSVFPQVFNPTTVHQHCAMVVDLFCIDPEEDISPEHAAELKEQLSERVFQPSIIGFIAKSVCEQSKNEIISIDALYSITSDTLYQINAFRPCPIKINDIIEAYLECSLMEEGEGFSFRDGLCYGITNAAWFVTNIIITLHFEAWKICYSTISVLGSEVKPSLLLGLEDLEFSSLWQDLITKPEIVALIQEEYEYAEYASASNEVVCQRMLELYACMVYVLQASGQRHWSTLFPPLVMQKIIDDWAVVIPSNLGSAPILTILMNMFAHTWLCQKGDCTTKLKINQMLYEMIRKVSHSSDQKAATKTNKKTKKRSKK